MKRNLVILLVVATILVSTLACSFSAGGLSYNSPTQATQVVVPTSAPAVVDLDQKTVGNPSIWNQPQNKGVMTTDGDITYVQSGKPNEIKVVGSVGNNQTLVVTAYRVDFQGKIMDNGVVFTIPGPFSLNEDPLVMVDGAATLVANDSTQSKLDSMWVDFCRGDRTSDGTAWTYKPWALAHVSVGTFAFPDLSTCFGAAEDDYPNNPPRP